MDPILGEIKLWAINFAPQGWLACDGSLLPINQYQALYSLLSTQYGGDGRTNFALPDLRGRVPVHHGSARNGTKGGSEAVTLNTQQVPAHTHTVNVNNEAANVAAGLAHHLAAPVTRSTPPQNINLYVEETTAHKVTLHPDTVGKTGGAAHNNMQPFLVLNYYIAAQGVYPQRP